MIVEEMSVKHAQQIHNRAVKQLDKLKLWARLDLMASPEIPARATAQAKLLAAAFARSDGKLIRLRAALTSHDFGTIREMKMPTNHYWTFLISTKEWVTWPKTPEDYWSFIAMEPLPPLRAELKEA